MSNRFLRTPPPRGFTLIEVMIVVAIIGILAAIAYPSYVEHIKRGRRAEAQTALLEAAQFMQRIYAANNRYDKTLANADVELPDSLKNHPNLAYTIGFKENELDINKFVLVAARTGAMSQDRCGDFTLDQVGKRDLDNEEAGVAVKDCWK